MILNNLLQINAPGVPLLLILSRRIRKLSQAMEEAKNTQRAIVRIGYDGRVHKYFKGPDAPERFANEVKVLKYLERKKCPFVPRCLEADTSKFYIVTTNCGAIVQHISKDRQKQLFAELEQYGVRHDDPFKRNITYNAQQGRFCIIDFEFATLLEEENEEPSQSSDQN